MYSSILRGARLVQLQKWRLMQNATFSSVETRKGESFTVTYLVDSLGFTTNLAESISKRVTLEEKGNADSVLSLFRRYGFTDSQTSSIITGYPLLLIADSEKCLSPKLQFLQSRVASSSEVTEIVSKVPQILGKRMGKAIGRCYDSVKEIMEADGSSKSCLQKENKIRNLLVLRELGVPQQMLFSLLVSVTSPVHGKERFEESLKKVVEMGFDPTTLQFVNALRVVYNLSDRTIEAKVDAYKKLGFDVGEVWGIFRKWPHSLQFSEKKILNTLETFVGLGFTRDEFLIMVKRRPQCVGYSGETVKKKIEFVVKEMNWSLKDVVLRPQIVGYSMEKRIVPRCSVIKALMSKGLLGRETPPVSYALACSDHAFLNKYVLKHDDKLVFELMAIFTKIGSAGTTKASTDQSGYSTCARSVMTIASEFGIKSRMQEHVASMARQYVRGIISSVQRVALALSPSHIRSQVGLRTPLGTPEAQTLARWICQSYRCYMGVELLKSNGEGNESILKNLWHHTDAIICCSMKALPVFTFANQAGLDMLETTLVALQDISLEKIIDDNGRKTLCSEFPQIMQQGFACLQGGICLSTMGRPVSYERAVAWKVLNEEENAHCICFVFINWSFV